MTFWHTLPLLAFAALPAVTIAEENAIQIGTLIQTDARAYFSPDNAVDNLLIRRARIDVQGQVAENIRFRLLPEFSDGNDNGHLLDAYVDIQTSDTFSWRIGKFKSPIGIERIQSVPRLAFIERGLTDNLVPNRDVGIAVNFRTDFVKGSLGLANNAGDRQDTDIDSDNGKAFYIQGETHTSLPGLSLGMAASIGNAQLNTALPTYKTSGRTTVFRYADDVMRDGKEHRVAVHAKWYYEQFGSFAEFVSSQTHLLDGNNERASITNTGWQVVASWMLTGESNAWAGVIPDNATGAWELLFRVSELTLDDNAFNGFALATDNIKGATSAAIGLSWYANTHIKVLFNYEHTTFYSPTDFAAQEDERLLSARLQLFY